MNATIPAQTVAEALAEDAGAAAREWLANFRTDCERLFTREVVEGAVAPGRHELPPVRATRYFGFTDPSGGSADAMTAAVAHVEGQRIVVDAVRERVPPFSPAKVTLRVC